MTAARYNAMALSQGGVCAVCHKPETRQTADGRVFRLTVDHDHRCCRGAYSCGACVRGMLCHNCNTGSFGDSPALYRAMADYIEKFEEITGRVWADNENS